MTTERHDRDITGATFHVRANEDDDGLTLEGHAAVFNTPAAIRDFLGTYDEVIAPGAFAHTIRNGSPILMFNHGHHPMVGDMPIGSITDLREDQTGLFVKARLHDNWLTEPVRDAIASQAIDGMSFRFSVPEGKEDWVQPADRDDGGADPLRVVREVKLFELGPVTFPAYDATSVLVRSLSERAPDLAERLTPTPEPQPEPEPEVDDQGSTPGQRAARLRELDL